MVTRLLQSKIWISMESNINYIFGILRRHISTPCTQFLSLITSLTYRFLKDYVGGGGETTAALVMERAGENTDCKKEGRKAERKMPHMGACTSDVHTGRGEGGTPKANESTDK